MSFCSPAWTVTERKQTVAKQTIARYKLSRLRTAEFAVRHLGSMEVRNICGFESGYRELKHCSCLMAKKLHEAKEPLRFALSPNIANDSANNMPNHGKRKKYLGFSLSDVILDHLTANLRLLQAFGF